MPARTGRSRSPGPSWFSQTIPVTALIGPTPATIQLGSVYADAGATCTDEADDNPTLSSAGTVDTSTIGTYQITYTCTDSSDNEAAPLTRTITVADQTIPVITNSDNTAQFNQTATVQDQTAPVITLTGGPRVWIAVGVIYSDRGSTCTD